MADLELKLRLSADNRGLVQVIDASGNKVAELGAESERAGRRSEQGFARARKGVTSLGEQIRIARQQLLAFIGLQLSGQLIGQLGRLADEYTQLNSRIGLVTSSQQQANATFDALFEIAQRTRSELSATGELFTTLARSTQNLGLSQQQLLQITETINQSFIVSGANADSARAAITQLSQGLAAGALRGEEFNSVAEQAPILMDLLGQSLNMTRGELREFAATGGITSEILTTALLQGAADVQKQFDGMQPTIAQAKQQLDNAFTRFVGESAEASGAAKLVADSLSGLAKNLDTVIDLATAGAVVIGSRYVGALIAARAATAFNTIEAIRYQAALARMAGASGVATAAMGGLAAAGRGLLAVFGGPAGVILAIGSLAALFGGRFVGGAQAAARETDELIGRIDQLTKSLTELDRQTTQQTIADTEQQLAAIDAEIAALSARRSTLLGLVQGTAEISAEIRALEAEQRKLREGLPLLNDRLAELDDELRGGTDASAESAAGIDKLTGSIREQITQLQAQQIELTAGKEAAAAFEDALLAADLAARAEAEGVELSTEKIQALVAERRRLLEANEDAAAAQRRATEAQREAERANDAAFESLRSLVEEFERSEQAARDFELENQRLAAELGGPVTTAAFEYSLAIRQALELLERGDITVEQFRQRVALLREEFERGAEAAAGGIGFDSLAGRLSRSIIEGADITDAIGRSLRSFGGERIARDLEGVFQSGFNRAMEGLELTDEARENLEAVGAPIALAIGQITEGNVGEGVGSAVGAIAGVAVARALDAVAPGVGAAVGSAIGGLFGGLFGGGKVPKFQVSGAATAPFRDIGPRNQDRLDTAIGDFFLGLRELDAETEDAVANALVGFASTIAGVVRDVDLLAEIERQIANTKFSSRSDGESIERLIGEVFDNVLDGIDAGVAAFIRRGGNLEERLARFEAAFAVQRRLVGRRGLGLTGEGFTPDSGGGGGTRPPFGGGGGGGIGGPGFGTAPRIQAQERREFEAVIQGIGDAASLSNPALLQTLELLDELQIGSESLVDTFNRLVGVTNLLDRVVALTGTQIGATREEMVRFGADLVAFFGDSAEALGQQLGIIFDRFFSDEERLTAQAESARERFAALLGDLGIELTDELLTEGGFRALFDELSGLLSPEDLAILIEAGVALDGMLDAEEALAEARGESAESTRDAAAIAEILAGLEFDATRAGLEGLDLALFDINRRFDELRAQLIESGATAAELAALESQRADAIAAAERNQLESVLSQIFDGAETPLASLNRRFNEAAAAIAGVEGAESALIAIRFEQQRALAALAQELRASVTDSIDDLFGETGQAADSAARSVGGATDALRDMSGVAESLRDTILRIQGGAGTSTLGPTGRRDFLQQQFDAALASGDLEQANQIAPQLAQAIRDAGASSSDADDRIRDLLEALEGAAQDAESSGGGPPTSGQVGGIQQTTERIEQRALEQIQVARQIVSEIAQLADIEQTSGIALAAELGAPLDRLVEILGVDLADISVEQVRILGQLAEDFNEPIAALEEALGISLGELSDATSLLNDGLERAIDGLPPEIAGPLTEALRKVEETGDVSFLERVVGALPPNLANELAPFLDGIDVQSEVQITNRLLGEQTSVIAGGFAGLQQAIGELVRSLRDAGKQSAPPDQFAGPVEQGPAGPIGGVIKPPPSDTVTGSAAAADIAALNANNMTREDAQALLRKLGDVERAVLQSGRLQAQTNERAARLQSSRTSRVTS